MAMTALTAALPGATLTSPTFNRDVLPILQKNCQSCHRPGQVAPMPLLTYQQTRPWSKAIKAAVLTKKMPPWPADPRYGHFLNDRSLKPDDVSALVAWVDGGSIEGNASDKPPDVEWKDGWAIQPDVVITLPPIRVPAKGVVDLTDITIPSGFKKDTWIASIEIRPSNPSVVHHVVLAIEPHTEDTEYGVSSEVTKRDPEGVAIKKISKKDSLRSLTELDAAYLPGNAFTDYSLHNSAKLIPAGSDLLIQAHYTTNGTAATDETQIGFRLTKAPPDRQFVTVRPTALRDGTHFRIPAGDPNWESSTEIVFNQDARIVWFLPHMHLRGKDMEYRLLSPGHEPQTLLRVKWDFNWQYEYDLEEPIAVSKGSKLQIIAHFDNSANNPLNPNSGRDVRWGDQTWEEMMVAWFGAVVSKDTDPAKVVSYTRQFLSSGRASPR